MSSSALPRARGFKRPQKLALSHCHCRTVALSHCRFVLPPIHPIPDPRTSSAPLFLRRRCGRTLDAIVDQVTSLLVHGLLIGATDNPQERATAAAKTMDARPQGYQQHCGQEEVLQASQGAADVANARADAAAREAGAKSVRESALRHAEFVEPWTPGARC